MQDMDDEIMELAEYEPTVQSALLEGRRIFFVPGGRPETREELEELMLKKIHAAGLEKEDMAIYWGEWIVSLDATHGWISATKLSPEAARKTMPAGVMQAIYKKLGHDPAEAPDICWYCENTFPIGIMSRDKLNHLTCPECAEKEEE